jgi:hypothetical protein
MTDDRPPPFAFPAVHGKKITAAFDGWRITSNGGVKILAAAESTGQIWQGRVHSRPGDVISL